MRSFCLTHVYDVSPRELMDFMLDPALTPLLEESLPDLERRYELERVRRGNIVERRVQCVPVPKIPEAARNVVRPEMVSWVETARFDLERLVVDVEILPAGFRNIFAFKGQLRVEGRAEGGSVRRLDAGLEIKMFIVGRFVEDYLIEEIRRNMQIEGDVLRDFVGGRRAAQS